METTREETGTSQLDVNDPEVEEKLVSEVKEQGIFDQLRKECLSDVDTKPGYQNLKMKVENTLELFIKKNSWNPKLNKNQLRAQLRKQIESLPGKDQAILRLVDQLVDPKLSTSLTPEVEALLVKHFGDFLNESMEENQDTEMEVDGEGRTNGNLETESVNSEPGLEGQMSPLTPGREDRGEGSPGVEGNISPLTPCNTPPQPTVVQMEVDKQVEIQESYTPPPRSEESPSYTPPPRKAESPSYTPPPPADTSYTPQPPATSSLPPPLPSPTKYPHQPPPPGESGSGEEASMSSISDTEMADVSPPRRSSPSNTSSPTRNIPLPDDSSRSSRGQGGVSTPPPPLGDQITSQDESQKEEKGGMTDSSEQSLTELERMKDELMAKLEGDFKLSPEEDSSDDSEGELDTEEDTVQKEKPKTAAAAADGSPITSSAADTDNEKTEKSSDDEEKSEKSKDNKSGKSPPDTSPEHSPKDDKDDNDDDDDGGDEGGPGNGEQEQGGSDEPPPPARSPADDPPSRSPGGGDPPAKSPPATDDDRQSHKDSLPPPPPPSESLKESHGSVTDPRDEVDKSVRSVSPPNQLQTIRSLPLPCVPEDKPPSGQPPSTLISSGQQPPTVLTVRTQGFITPPDSEGSGTMTPPDYQSGKGAPASPSTSQPQSVINKKEGGKGPSTPPEPAPVTPEKEASVSPPMPPQTPPSPFSTFSTSFRRPPSPPGLLQEAGKKVSTSSSSKDKDGKEKKEKEKEREKKHKEGKLKEHREKLAKVEQKVKSKDKLKSDKYQDLDIFSTTKKPVTPHQPHRPPTVSGTVTASTNTTPVTSKTQIKRPDLVKSASRDSSSSSSSRMKDSDKDKDSDRHRSKESKSAKISDRRRSSDSSREHHSSSKDHHSSSKDHHSSSKDHHSSSKDHHSSHKDHHKSSKHPSRESSTNPERRHSTEHRSSKDDHRSSKDDYKSSKDDHRKDHKKDERRHKDDIHRAKDVSKDKMKEKLKQDKGKDVKESKEREKERIIEETKKRLAEVRRKEREKEEEKKKEKEKEKGSKKQTPASVATKSDGGIMLLQEQMKGLDVDEIKMLLLQTMQEKVDPAKLVNEIDVLLNKKKEPKQKETGDKDKMKKDTKKIVNLVSSDENSDIEVLNDTSHKKKESKVEEAKTPVAVKEVKKVRDLTAKTAKTPTSQSITSKLKTPLARKLSKELDSDESSSSDEEHISHSKSSTRKQTKAKQIVSSDDDSSDDGEDYKPDKAESARLKSSGGSGSPAKKMRTRGVKVNISKLKADLSSLEEDTEEEKQNREDSQSSTDSEFEVKVDRVDLSSDTQTPEPEPAPVTASPTNKQKAKSKVVSPKSTKKQSAPVKTVKSPPKKKETVQTAEKKQEEKKIVQKKVEDKKVMSPKKKVPASPKKLKTEEKRLSGGETSLEVSADSIPEVEEEPYHGFSDKEVDTVVSLKNRLEAAMKIEDNYSVSCLNVEEFIPDYKQIEIELPGDCQSGGLLDLIETSLGGGAKTITPIPAWLEPYLLGAKCKPEELEMPTQDEIDQHYKKQQKKAKKRGCGYDIVVEWVPTPPAKQAKTKAERELRNDPFSTFFSNLEESGGKRTRRANNRYSSAEYSTSGENDTDSAAEQPAPASSHEVNGKPSDDKQRSSEDVKPHVKVTSSKERINLYLRSAGVDRQVNTSSLRDSTESKFDSQESKCDSIKSEEVESDVKDSVKPSSTKTADESCEIKQEQDVKLERDIDHDKNADPQQSQETSSIEAEAAYGGCEADTTSSVEVTSSTTEAKKKTSANSGNKQSSDNICDKPTLNVESTKTESSDVESTPTSTTRPKRRRQSGVNTPTEVESSTTRPKRRRVTNTDGVESSVTSEDVEPTRMSRSRNQRKSVSVEPKESSSQVLEAEMEATEAETREVLAYLEEARKSNLQNSSQQTSRTTLLEASLDQFFGWDEEEVTAAPLTSLSSLPSGVGEEDNQLDEGGVTFGLLDLDLLSNKIFPASSGEETNLEVIMSPAIQKDLRTLQKAQSRQQVNVTPAAAAAAPAVTEPLKVEVKEPLLRPVKDHLDLRNGSDGSDSDDKGSMSPTSSESDPANSRVTRASDNTPKEAREKRSGMKRRASTSTPTSTISQNKKIKL